MTRHLQQTHAPMQARLSELVRDACRFARCFARSIDEHPLLVYMSALPFTPMNTILYRTFHCADLYPSVLGGFQHSWSPLSLVMEAHFDVVNAVSFSPDGTLIVSGSDDRTLRVWNSLTGAEVSEMRGHRHAVQTVKFSPDGRRIISGSSDYTVRVWDLATSAEVLPNLREHGDTVSSVEFSPDGTRFVSGSYDMTLRVWDATTGTKISELRGNKGRVNSASFSPDGTMVVSGSDDRTVRIWDVASSTEVGVLKGHRGAVLSVHFSKDGHQITSYSEDHTHRLWNVTAEIEISDFRWYDGGARFSMHAPHGTTIVSALNSGIICVLDAASRTEVKAMQGHRNIVTSLDFSPDGRRVVSCSADKTVRVWDVTPVAEVPSTLQGHGDGTSSVAFSLDGTKIVSGSQDMTIRVWDATTGAGISTMRGHEDSVTSVSFSPEGNKIVSGSYDQTIRIWDATSGAEISKLRAHTSAVHSVAFSPDGKMVVSSSDDTTICVWDAISGTVLSTMRGHEKAVTTATFSPTGHQIASGSRDKTVRVWDVASGSQTSPALRHGHWVSSVGFSVDGNHIISESFRDSISWDAKSGRRYHSTERSDHCLLRSIYITYNGWIVDVVTNRTLCKIPSILAVTCEATHKRSLVVGTKAGRLCVMHFPSALLTSPETLAAKGQTRERYPNLTGSSPERAGSCIKGSPTSSQQLRLQSTDQPTTDDISDPTMGVRSQALGGNVV